MLKKIMQLLALLPALVVAQPLDKVVAVVNDDVITARELDEQVALLTRQMQARQVTLPSSQSLKKQVLQHMIDVNLQLQLAKNNNIAVDNSELDEAILRIATNNHLTLAQLQKAVSEQGMAWENYRENIRKEMLLQQMQQRAVGQDIVISQKQVDDYMRTMVEAFNPNQVYHLLSIVIPLPDEPSKEQLKRAENKAQSLVEKLRHGVSFDDLIAKDSSPEFALEQNDLGDRRLQELPELFSKQVISMKTGEFSGPIRTGNGFQIIYLISKTENKAPHQVTKTHVRHILLKQAASMTNEEAQKQINNIYQQVKAGASFDVMAKKYSLDATSAEKGGDLGWVTSDELVPEFSKAMDGLAIHQISQPIKSMFGWHIIEVLDRKVVDDSDTFKRQQARQQLQQKKLAEAVNAWQQHIRTQSYVKILDKDLG